MKAFMLRKTITNLRFNRLKSFLFILTFATIGSILLFTTRAAGPFATLEPEQGTKAAATVTGTDTQASGSQYVQFGGDTPTTPEKPGPTNTGPSNPGILTPSGSIVVTQEGAVIENVDITGIIQIKANNVTIRNFRINANQASYGIQTTYGFTGATIEDGEIYNMNSAGILGAGFTARRLNIHDSNGDAIKPQGSSTGLTLIESSWLHRLGKGDGAHADGFQSRSGSNMTFRYNNCDMPINEKGGPGEPYKSNACFILQAAEGPLDNYLIENNWLNGGNYTFYCDGTNVRVMNNRFGRDYRFGIKSGCGGVTWTGNVWDDTGEPIP